MPERQLLEHRHHVVDGPVRHRLAGHGCAPAPRTLSTWQEASSKVLRPSLWSLRNDMLRKLKQTRSSLADIRCDLGRLCQHLSMSSTGYGA